MTEAERALLQYLASRQREHEEHVIGTGAGKVLDDLMAAAGLHYTTRYGRREGD